MSSAIRRLESALSGSSSSRRRFLKNMAGACAGLVAFAAGVADPIKAFACTMYDCCCLQFSLCNNPYGSCPSGETNPYTWYCPYGRTTYACGECYSSHCSWYQNLGTAPAA
jgi:hypothetical protein